MRDEYAVTREFCGQSYRCKPFGAMQAWHLSQKIITTLGSELVPILFGAVDGSGELDLAELGKRLEVAGSLGLLERLRIAGESFADEILLGVLESVTPVNAKGELGAKDCAADFDRHFSDRGGLKRAMLVWAWAGEVNFRHFLDVGPSETGTSQD